MSALLTNPLCPFAIILLERIFCRGSLLLTLFQHLLFSNQCLSPSSSETAPCKASVVISFAFSYLAQSWKHLNIHYFVKRCLLFISLTPSSFLCFDNSFFSSPLLTSFPPFDIQIIIPDFFSSISLLPPQIILSSPFAIAIIYMLMSPKSITSVLTSIGCLTSTFK